VIAADSKDAKPSWHEGLLYIYNLGLNRPRARVLKPCALQYPPLS